MKPQKSIKGLTFYPVPEFDGASVAFGAEDKHYFKRHDLPDVPSEFEDMVQQLFFQGGVMPKLHDSVDVEKAAKAVNAWLCSFAPPHESKIATVAYAFWLWTHESALDGE